MYSKPLLETQLLQASKSIVVAECQQIVAELILGNQWVTKPNLGALPTKACY